MNRARLARLVPLATLGLLGLFVFPLVSRGPTDQTIHYVLGDLAPRVREVDARWAEEGAASPTASTAGATHAEKALPRDTPCSLEDWTREVTFRYAPGKAPRVITHEPRLANGDYIVEVTIAASSCDPSAAGSAERSYVQRRHVHLGGGVASIDLAPGELTAHLEPPPSTLAEACPPGTP